MNNNLKNHDRWLSIKYETLPNCVSPFKHKVFGLDDLDDNWLLDITYREVMKNECN